MLGFDSPWASGQFVHGERFFRVVKGVLLMRGVMLASIEFGWGIKEVRRVIEEFRWVIRMDIDEILIMGVGSPLELVGLVHQ